MPFVTPIKLPQFYLGYITRVEKICGLLVVKSKKFSKIPQSRDKTSPATSDSDESFESEPEWNTGITNWLFSKDCHWGPEHAKNVAKYAIGKNW